MKRVATLAFVLAVGSLPYVLAQQQTEQPTRLPPVSLSSTAHAALPKDLSHYWFVPSPAELRASRARRDGVVMGFARGVKAVVAGDFATGLPLVSPATLNESRLRDHARYYRAVALQGLVRADAADGRSQVGLGLLEGEK